MARTYYVGANEVLVSPNWKISDKINARSTMNVTIIDKKSATITDGAEFTMYNGAVKIFNGIISKITTYEDDPNYLYYELQIVDNSALADRLVIAKTYDDKTAGYIVNDIITSVLSGSGVTAGTIATGASIKKAVFNYIKVSSALDYIKNLTGLNWYIDKDKKLQFFDRATNVSPWELTNTVQHNKFKQESSLDNYRNVQYVRGGKGRTASQINEIPTPAPDGKSRNFIMRFAVAERPTIEINLNGSGWVAINSADVGINGLNKNKKWYYTFGSQVLTQDEAESVLSSNDAIRVTYVGLRNIFLKVENSDGITSFGKYEALTTEKAINTTEQAIEYGKGLIQTYGEIKDTISFSTEVSGLQAGQLLTVNKPLYGINDKFLIESVEITASGADTINYDIKALDGVAIGGWEEFFKELLKGNRDYAINENEVLILLYFFNENSGIDGDINIKVYNALYPNNSLYPSNTLYPGTLAQEVNLSD